VAIYESSAIIGVIGGRECVRRCNRGQGGRERAYKGLYSSDKLKRGGISLSEALIKARARDFRGLVLWAISYKRG
jgi:hypothetical protein